MTDLGLDTQALLRPVEKEDTNPFGDFLRSAAYSGIQAPIEGVSQLVNKTVGSNVIPEVRMIDAPKHAEFGSTRWHAQTIGGAVGMLAPFMAVNKGVGSLMRTEAAAMNSLRFKVTQAATAGFVYDGLMRPVQDNEGNFWAARLKHATVGAVTFGTLAGTGHALDAVSKPILFNHTVAGITAGGTNAQLESLLSGKGFASTEDTMRGGYTFAVVGLGLRGIETGKEAASAKVRDVIMRRELRSDLREVPVRMEDGRVVDVVEKINAETALRPEQKERVLGILGEVRDNYYKIDNALPKDHPNKGYQIVNWKHTRGEIDPVLESSKMDRQMKAQEIEDAMIASTFSDSVKTPQNFITHHLDGARLAEQVLPKYFDKNNPVEAARMKGIIESIKEHQIGPPAFMGMMTEMFIRNSIKGEIGGKTLGADAEVVTSLNGKLDKPGDHAVNGKVQLSEQEGVLLDRIGTPRSLVENATELANIRAKISNPFENVSAENRGIVDFTDIQRGYLNRVGLNDWYVPNEATPWYRQSRKLINGDSLINYASPDGWAKIAQIRGPNTGFPDKTIWDSLASAKQSYNDAMTVIEAQVAPLAEAGLRRTEAAVERVTPKVQQWVDANKQGYGYEANEKVSFWDRDAEPLRYPEKGTPLEARDALRFDFARQIRDKMVAELRAQQGNYSEQP
jgi:hypothetical protein